MPKILNQQLLSKIKKIYHTIPIADKFHFSETKSAFITNINHLVIEEISKKYRENNNLDNSEKSIKLPTQQANSVITRYKN